MTNRRAERAEEVASRYSGGAVNFEAFYAVLPSADIVLCSTGARTTSFAAAETKRALKSRKKGRCCLSTFRFRGISIPAFHRSRMSFCLTSMIWIRWSRPISVNARRKPAAPNQ